MRLWATLILLCTLVVAAGALLLRESGRTQSQAELVANWSRTNGSLVEIRIFYHPLIKVHTNYAAEAFYTFEVDGRRYTGKGMFDPSTAATLDGLKDGLKEWLSDPYARVSETPGAVGVAYTYTPLAETVPVYYDPSDPARSFFGNPSSGRPDLGGMRIVGWGVLLGGAGALCLVIFAAVARDPYAGRQEQLRARLEAEASAGLIAPSHDDVQEFVRLLDLAIGSIEEAIRQDAAYRRLEGALDSMRHLRREPVDGLLYSEHLGFSRWLSGEWDLEGWGPPGARIMAAIEAVESFHRRWRATARTRLAAPVARA